MLIRPMITFIRCSQITRLPTSATKILPLNSTTPIIIISRWEEEDLVSAWVHQVSSRIIMEAGLTRGTAVTTDTCQEGIMGWHGLSNSSLMVPLIPSRCSIVLRVRPSITSKGPILMVLITPSALAAVSMLH